MTHPFLNNLAIQALLDNLPSAVLAVQQSGKIVLSNRAAQILLEYSDREFKLLPDIGVVQDIEALERLRREMPLPLPSKPLSQTELLFVAAERFSGAARRWKCRNKAGHSLHVMLTMVLLPITLEMTEPIMLFIASSGENADELRNLKTQLLSRISHEIRTPIHGIVGALEILTSTPVNQEQRELLSLARSKADVLLSLINDIFEYSRTAQGLALTLERTAAEPRVIMENLLEITSERFISRHIEWIADINDAVPQQVFCDPVRLYQVLLTITSALATSLQHGSVSITTEFLSVNHSPHSNLYFTIRGKAEQIDEFKQDQILATLQDNEDVADLSPEILQLSLARTVITALGGFIWGEAKGQGREREMCLFVFTSVEMEQTDSEDSQTDSQQPSGSNQELLTTPPRFARFQPNATDEPSHSATPDYLLTNATVDGHTKSPSVKNILIVDDDSDNCLLAVQFLRSLKLDGHHTIECTIANTGVEAFMAVQKQQFDAILMDIQMPVMDGFEATAHIRTFEKHHQQKRTPIIAVTAHTMENYRELCLENNMDDYMSKPVKKQPFHEMVKKWLNRSCNILVTDDSDDYRLLLKLQLNKNQQFAPIFATNGQEAIDVCQKQRIDVVLLDMQMPVLTGYEAAPLIRELPGYSDIPIWGLTAHEDEQEIRRVLEAGCNRCFTKSGLSVIRGIVRELENHFSLTAQAPST
ncbi:MAG: response regulator [Candidatus Kapaibacteriota bacterium]|jgi:CheY-like chemotaxis protein